ncbi:MFS transporter [Paenibacillus sp. YYML68]|uniref:MFS transporter n=1 Tax=Paenibacillus sp. YYML68 TaxID=2909250 RepID=UPI002492FB72|nr:MFS transporter [Paenibacillus sp. YYML68]
MTKALPATLSGWLESRRSSIPPDKRLSNEAAVSLFIHFCFQFGASMSGVFLTLYLWRLTESLTINAIYFATSFSAMMVGFVFGGWMIKKKDRMVVYRIGIAMNAVFYLAVVFAGELVASWYLLFAIGHGIAGAFYWVGYLTLMYEVSTDQNRIRYLALNTTMFMLGGLVGPALAGFLIRMNDGLQGYTLVFGIACVMFFIASIGSLRIKSNASHHRTYYLKYSGLLIRKHKRWAKSMYGFLSLGLLQGLMLFLPNILLFRLIPREDIVGYLGVLFALLSIGASMYISRFGNESLAKRMIVLSTLGFVLGTLFIVADMSIGSVLIFMILYSVCAPLQGNTITVFFYRTIGELPLRGELRVESVVLREIFINIGRIIAIVSFVLVLERYGIELLPWVLLVAAALQITLYLFVENGSGEPKPLAPVDHQQRQERAEA